MSFWVQTLLSWSKPSEWRDVQGEIIGQRERAGHRAKEMVWSGNLRECLTSVLKLRCLNRENVAVLVSWAALLAVPVQVYSQTPETRVVNSVCFQIFLLFSGVVGAVTSLL